ncbi:hypothetical protein E2C01_017192 [Portunus trituberculatus]|uniref:Uncharacterized protein n=1 Tax=Portunus trituberculatus TaxID=210409 RepID=A0A5B7DRQ2_PORTR|nr:hypothetical protein [Portunus trituberculatus]
MHEETPCEENKYEGQVLRCSVTQEGRTSINTRVATLRYCCLKEKHLNKRRNVSSYTLFFHSLGGDNGRVNLEIQKVDCGGADSGRPLRARRASIPASLWAASLLPPPGGKSLAVGAPAGGRGALQPAEGPPLASLVFAWLVSCGDSLEEKAEDTRSRDHFYLDAFKETGTRGNLRSGLMKMRKAISDSDLTRRGTSPPRLAGAPPKRSRNSISRYRCRPIWRTPSTTPARLNRCAKKKSTLLGHGRHSNINFTAGSVESYELGIDGSTYDD